MSERKIVRQVSYIFADGRASAPSPFAGHGFVIDEAKGDAITIDTPQGDVITFAPNETRLSKTIIVSPRWLVREDETFVQAQKLIEQPTVILANGEERPRVH